MYFESAFIRFKSSSLGIIYEQQPNDESNQARTIKKIYLVTLHTYNIDPKNVF